MGTMSVVVLPISTKIQVPLIFDNVTAVICQLAEAISLYLFKGIYTYLNQKKISASHYIYHVKINNYFGV